MMDTRPGLTPDQTKALHIDISNVLKNAVMGLSMKHNTDTMSVSQIMVDTLVGWMATISPTGTALYLRAAADLVEDRHLRGTMSDETTEALRRADRSIQSDQALYTAGAAGSA